MSENDLHPIERNNPEQSSAAPSQDGLNSALGALGRFLNRGERDLVEVPEGKTVMFDLNYNFAAALCYFPIALCILAPALWLKTESADNKYLRFHAIQGLCLAGIMIGIQVILGTLGKIIKFIPLFNLVVPLLLALLGAVVSMIWGVICVKQMLRVYKRQTGRLPVIAKFADKWV